MRGTQSMNQQQKEGTTDKAQLMQMSALFDFQQSINAP